MNTMMIELTFEEQISQQISLNEISKLLPLFSSEDVPPESSCPLTPVPKCG